MKSSSSVDRLVSQDSLGTYELRESVRQMRGIASEISVCRGVGGMFAAPGTIIVERAAVTGRESLIEEAVTGSE